MRSSRQLHSRTIVFGFVDLMTGEVFYGAERRAFDRSHDSRRPLHEQPDSNFTHSL